MPSETQGALRDLAERRFRCLIGGWSALSLAGGAILFLLMNQKGLIGLTVLTIGLLAIGTTCLTSARRYTRVRRGLNTYALRTCPLCGRDATEQPCCQRLPAGWSTSDVEAYWADRSCDISMAYCLRRGNPSSSLAWWVEQRNRVIGYLLGFSGIILISAIAAIAFYPRFFASDAPIFVSILFFWPIMIAAVIWIHSKREFTRTGCCWQCGHTISPGKLSSRCLECGEALSQGTIAYARLNTTHVAWFAVLNIPLALIPLIDFLGTSGAMPNAMAVLPTPALLQLAAADNGLNTLAWNELAKRELIPDQNLTLLDAILNERVASPTFTDASDRGAWLRGVFDDGVLSNEALKRLRCETWIAEVSLPETLLAGTPFSPILSGERRQPYLPPATGIAILFDGFSINDGPFHGGESSTLWVLHADSLDWSKDGYRHFTTPITIELPGEHRLVTRYWLMDRPFGALGKAVERDASGTPLLPAKSTFLIPITINETIHVQPATP